MQALEPPCVYMEKSVRLLTTHLIGNTNTLGVCLQLKIKNEAFKWIQDLTLD